MSILKTERIPISLMGVTKHQAKSVGVVVFIAVASCILFLYNPARWNFYPPCPFHFLTNYYCPGCGSLRALHQLFHGNIMGALDLNPLMVLSLPFLGYSFLSDTIRMLRKNPDSKRYIPAFLIYLFLATVILFWILRNIPYYPFLWLAP